jgi:hypothetical protein
MYRPVARIPAYLLVVIPVVSLCLACALLAGASQVLAAQLDEPLGYVTPMCAWARNGSVGLWWNSNVPPGRAFARAHRYNAVCVALPWSTNLPATGRPALDVSP